MANKLKRRSAQDRAAREKERIDEIALKAKKKDRKPSLFRDTFRHGRGQDLEVTEVCDRIFDFLKEKRSRLYNYPPLNEMMKRMICLHGFFIRDLADLKLKGKSPRKHFYQLVNHLLVKYPLPSFWENVWEENDVYDHQNWLLWYIAVAQGEGPRVSCPIKITKKQSHRFMQSPPKYHPGEALRIIQFLDEGGDAANIRGLMQCTQIMNISWRPDEEREEFFKELMRWFGNQTMFDCFKYKEICDWALYRKFGGFAEERQPNLTMRGRTAETVLRDVEEWHRELNRDRRDGIRRHPKGSTEDYWEGYLIKDWTCEQGSKIDRNGVYIPNVWSIYQITDYEGLLEEGRVFRHCVTSYFGSCREGKTSIWSMSLNGKKQLTIEISQNGVICQVRGRSNRLPVDKEAGIIKKFAKERNLSTSRFLASRNW